jgi:hypothetical protein
MNILANSLPFVYSPMPGGQECVDLPQLLQRTNDLNVPFSNHAYINAASTCMLPKWPVQKLLPVIDRTVDYFPVHNPYWEDGVNAYRDVLTDRVSQDGTWIPGPAEIISRSVPNLENKNILLEKTTEALKNEQKTVMASAMSQVHQEPIEHRKDRTFFQNFGQAVKGAVNDIKNKDALPATNKIQYVCTRNNRICYFLFLVLLVILSLLAILLVIKFFMFICR